MKNTFRLSLAFTKFYQDVWLKKNNKNLMQEDNKSAKQSFVVVSPNYIEQEIFSKFSPVQQHDCHEFFTHVISNLQDEENPLIQNVTNTMKEN